MTKQAMPQSVLDALADAETLRSMFTGVDGGDIVSAGLQGALAGRKMHGERCGMTTIKAYETARRAAKAAFRAVPGLRG